MSSQPIPVETSNWRRFQAVGERTSIMLQQMLQQQQQQTLLATKLETQNVEHWGRAADTIWELSDCDVISEDPHFASSWRSLTALSDDDVTFHSPFDDDDDDEDDKAPPPPSSPITA